MVPPAQLSSLPRVSRTASILCAVLLAACGTAAAPKGPAPLDSVAPALPTAAVVAAAEGELALDVAELI